MFRKLLPFSLILLIVISMFAVLYSPAAAAPVSLKPSRTPTKTKTPTRTPTPVIPSATPIPAGPWIMVTTPNDGDLLTNGDVYFVTWQSSVDIEFVSILIGYMDICNGCVPGWHTELAVGPILNSGSYDWTINVENPADKQFTVMIVGQSFNGTNYTILATDVSDVPFNIELSPFITPTFTVTPTSIPPTSTFTPTDTPEGPTATWTTVPPTSTFTPTPTRTRTPTTTPACSDC